MINTCLALVLAGFMGALPTVSGAQNYPVKPIRLIIPFPPGGIDIPGRLISTKVSEALGQPIVLDYRSGANGIIGCEIVSKAAPDGYTLLYSTSNTQVLAIYTARTLPYNPVKDFTPIALANEGGMFLAVHPTNPASSLKDLLEEARRNPGKISFASSGTGSFFQLMGEQIKMLAGLEMLHVPYKGTGPMQQAVMSGEVTMYFGSGSVFPLVNAGKLKLLAYLEEKRSAFRPEVAPITESLPGYQKISTWMGYFGPASLPRPIVTRLNSEIVKALSNAELRGKLGEFGYAAIGNTPEQAAQTIRTDVEVMGRIVKAAGIKPE